MRALAKASFRTLLPLLVGLGVAASMPANGATFVGNASLEITFTRLKNAPHIAYIVEVSDDMVTWQSGPDHTEELPPIDGGTTELVTVRDKTPMSGAQKRFIRLVVRPKP